MTSKEENMLEKCARAMCRADGVKPDVRSVETGGLLWRLYVPAARAVIEALMEPTPEMIANAELGYVTSMMDVEHNIAIVKGVFVSMLQSILQSKEEGGGG